MFSFFDFIRFLFGTMRRRFKVVVLFTYSPMLGKVVSEIIKCGHSVKILMPNEEIPSDIKLLVVATDMTVSIDEIMPPDAIPDNTPVDTMLTACKDMIKQAYDKSIPILALGNGGLFLRRILGGYITYQHALPIANELTIDIPWADKPVTANMVPPSVILKTDKAKVFITDSRGTEYGYIKDSDGDKPPIIICQMPLGGLEALIQTSVLNLAEYEPPPVDKPYEPTWVSQWKSGPDTPPADNKNDDDNDEEGEKVLVPNGPNQPIQGHWGIRYK